MGIMETIIMNRPRDFFHSKMLRPPKSFHKFPTLQIVTVTHNNSRKAEILATLVPSRVPFRNATAILVPVATLGWGVLGHIAQHSDVWGTAAGKNFGEPPYQDESGPQKMG